MTGVCECMCVQVKYENVNHRFTQECNTLTITGVVSEDEGTYTCRVQNIPDEQYEDTTQVLKLEYCGKYTEISLH